MSAYVQHAVLRLDERELLSLGLHRPFDRALAASGWALLAACALPVSHNGDRALFFVDVADSTYEAAAAAAQIFAGLVWIGLGRAAIPQRAKAVAAIAPLVIFALSLADAATTRAALLPFFPTPLQSRAFFFVACVVLGAAALRTGRRELSIAAGVSLAILYLWPGGVLGSMIGDVAIVSGQVPMATTELERIATTTLIASAFPAWLGIYLAVRGREKRGARDLVIFLALPVIMMVELGLRSSTEYGIDGHLGIAVRASVILTAIALVGAFVLEVLFESRPLLKENALTSVLSAASAFAVAFTVHAVALSMDQTPWDPAQPPAWADVLYRRVLPRIGDALAQERPLEALDAARIEATEAAATSPRLAAAISDLALLLRRGLDKDPDVSRAVRRINDVARRERLPFYVDVIIENRTDVYVLTYRIREVRHVELDGRELESLWVERHDEIQVIEQRLGWKPSHDRRALVLLDTVRIRWREELLPALRNQRVNRYTPYRDRLLGELTRATGLANVLLHEESAVAVIAEAVEAHELMHVLDGDKLIPPREVRATPLSFRSVSLEKAAAAELSAYLGEIARSPLPTLALADLEMVAEMETPRPEAIAGRIVRDLLLEDGEIPADVSERARALHRSLFGGDLPVSLQRRRTDISPGRDRQAGAETPTFEPVRAHSSPRSRSLASIP